MDITKILVACYKHDFWQTKACVASIRFWYPEIPIYLIKDELKGDFSTKTLQDKFNVNILSLEQTRYGWGLSKLEPFFFQKSEERYLIIDSDILFIGPLLKALNASEADFVVSPEYPDDPNTAWFKETYYSYSKLKEYDSNFIYPGFTFNTGQLVVNPGKINRQHFNNLISYSNTNYPALLRSDIFACADQGRLNYVLSKECINGNITIDKIDFMIYCASNRVNEISLASIKSKEGYPYLIHFAGRNKQALRKFDRSDIVRFFFKEYYKTQLFGSIKLFFLELRLEVKYNLLINLRISLSKFRKKFFRF